MNILFIGHLYEKSGWGDAARAYLKSLILTGHNIIARSIHVIDSPIEFVDDLRYVQDCLNKDMPSNINVCIQNVIPSYMTYYGGCKNIGLFFTETYNLNDTPWISNLSLMDELWLPNTDMINEFDYLPQPKFYIPCPIEQINTDNLTKMDLPTQGNYTFYFVGELIKRKNIDALIRAFYREFHTNESVSLMLKTYKYGASDADVNKATDSVVKHIQQNMKLYKTMDEYKKPILVNQHMSRIDMLRLHKSCDCLVIPSYGEGTCLPAMDAIMVGNNVISSDIGGMRHFVPYELRVKGRLEPVFEHNTINGFGTSRELWFSIDPLELQKKMRYVFEYHNNSKNARKKSLASIESLSTQSIAQTINARLSNATK
jgi:glycosyltransferase involved in cell wall biosynthesis